MAFWKDSRSVMEEINAGSVSKTSSGKEGIVTQPVQKGNAASVKDSVAELEDSLTKRYGNLRSALGPGTVIQGKLSFDTPVRIDGKLTGEIFSSTALIVGPKGEIDASISVKSLIVLGKVKGKIKALDAVEVCPGGELDGDVRTNLFSVAEGSRFNGYCDMGLQEKIVSVAPNDEPRSGKLDSSSDELTKLSKDK